MGGREWGVEGRISVAAGRRTAEAADVEKQWPLRLVVGHRHTHIEIRDIVGRREDVGIDALAPDVDVAAAEVLELPSELRRGRERQVGKVERRGQVPVSRDTQAAS